MDRSITTLPKDSEPSVDLNAVLNATDSLAAARDVVSRALAKKLSQTFSMPKADIEISKPAHAYGVDTLVAVEVRCGFLKEVKAEVAVFDILCSDTISDLSLLAAKESEYLPASLRECGTD